MRALILCLGLALSGCFLNEASPQKKLTDAVHELNNTARWGRVGQAASYVNPKYRQLFVARRAHWGAEIQLAETDVVHLQVGADQESAIALVTYGWYGFRDMTLHTTVIKQTWKSVDGTFALDEEEVVQGDPKLLKDVDVPAEGGDGMISLLGDPHDF